MTFQHTLFVELLTLVNVAYRVPGNFFHIVMAFWHGPSRVIGAALATTRPPRAALVVLLPADRIGSGGARLDPIMSG
jgi:hypothetical protein